MNYPVNFQECLAAQPELQQRFDAGWRDASLKRLPEYIDFHYQLGYFAFMGQRLNIAADGSVDWSSVKAIAGTTDSKEYCGYSF